MSGLRKKRSPVWQFFDERGDGSTAKCKFCTAVLKFDGNPSNLKKHLDAVHPTVKPDDGTEKGACPPAPKQQRLDFALKYAPTSSRQIIMTEKLLRMICIDMQPMSLVEDEGFRDLMHTADPRFTIPSRRTVGREISSLYDTTKEDVKAVLSKATNVCLTTDIWSSRAGHGYIGVTAHITDDWTMKTLVLTTELFKDDHTGANIAQTLMDVAKEWGIEEKVHLVVTDSAASMRLAMKKLPWESVPCMAHLLNLVVTDSRAKDEELEKVTKKLKEGVSYFHHSPKAMARLSETQIALGLPQHTLIQDVPTRWNSTLDMMERAVEQVDAMNSVLGVLGRAHLCISQEDVIALKGAILVLKPFKMMTEILSGEKYTTMSSIIPLLRGLRAMLEKTEGRDQLKNELKNQVDRRFGKSEEMSLLAYATILDPRYKKSAFKDASVASRHIRALYEEVSQLLGNRDKAETTPCDNRHHTSREESDGARLLDFLGDLDDSYTAECTPNYKAQAIVEMDQFMKQPRMPKEGDPLVYWRENRDRFPNVCHFALKYLTAPATSVPCERLFSAAGDLISAKRSRLSPENVDKILFLAKNLK